MFSKQYIDDLLLKVEIVDVIALYLPLRKTCTTFRCLCPFHKEKTASFVVFRSARSFHCFGCGAGGNVINFLMEYNHYSFSKAVIELAKMYKVPIRRIGKKGSVFETERKKVTRRKRQENTS